MPNYQPVKYYVVQEAGYYKVLSDKPVGYEYAGPFLTTELAYSAAKQLNEIEDKKRRKARKRRKAHAEVSTETAPAREV